MVTLFLHLTFLDASDVVLKMIAPSLPSGMAWHQGMKFLDDPDDGNDGYEVGCVYLDRLGNGSVCFFENQTCNCTPEILKEFEAVGWEVVSQS